ncbi:MAG: hypothetical protein ACPGRW_09495 [Flavobacteriaceae bacterium]
MASSELKRTYEPCVSSDIRYEYCNLERLHYGLSYVELSLRLKLEANVSFRGISQSHAIYEEVLGISVSGLHHSTVIQWVKRLGYYELRKPKPKSSNWVLIVDESVMIGQAKLLNIYGIPSEFIPSTRALELRDLYSLHVECRTSWTGEAIAEVIEQLDISISYIVSDNGNNLRKAYKLCQIPHISDITHYVALAFKQILATSTAYTSLSNELGKMRRTGVLSKKAHILPPNQRTKARFQNIDLLIKWLKKALWHNNNATQSLLSESEKKALVWVKSYGLFSEELQHFYDIRQLTFRYLKQRHYTPTVIEELKEQLLSFRKKASKYSIVFIQKIEAYLDRYKGLLHTHSKLLCCSDVIESSFGKLKNMLSLNSMCGFTDISMALAAFCNDLSPLEISKAMNFATWKEVYAFCKKRFTTSIFVKKQAFNKIYEKENIKQYYKTRNGANYVVHNTA